MSSQNNNWRFQYRCFLMPLEYIHSALKCIQDSQNRLCPHGLVPKNVRLVFLHRQRLKRGMCRNSRLSLPLIDELDTVQLIVSEILNALYFLNFNCSNALSKHYLNALKNNTLFGECQLKILMYAIRDLLKWFCINKCKIQISFFL